MWGVALRGLDGVGNFLFGSSDRSAASEASGLVGGKRGHAPSAAARKKAAASVSIAASAAAGEHAGGAAPKSIFGATPGLSSGAVLGMPPKAQHQEKQVQQQEVVVPLDDRERMAFEQEERLRARFERGTASIGGGVGGGGWRRHRRRHDRQRRRRQRPFQYADV